MREIPKSLLARWVALEDGDGVRLLTSRIRLLWAFGFVAWLAAMACVYYGATSWLALALAAVAGWLIAETNALRSRLEQWPSLRQYLDWQRIRDELKDAP
jgi:hypothetical protein